METKSSLKIDFLITAVLIQSFFQILLIGARHNGLFAESNLIYNDRFTGIALLVSMVVFVLVLLNIQKLRKVATQELIIETQKESLHNLGKLVETIQQQKHDFTNHLQVISGFCDLRNLNELSKYVREVTNEIVPHQQIMQIARLEIKSLLLVKSGLAKEKKINFVMAIADDFEAFPLCKIQAVNLLGNLLDNALKASMEAEEPFTKIYLGYEIGHNVIRIYNNGGSIPQSLGEDVFKKGYTTKKGSNGLGLHIIKSLVDQYNGTITYNSTPETGTEFIIRIPVAQPSTICVEDQ